MDGRDIVAAPGPFNRPIECAEIEELREHGTEKAQPYAVLDDVRFSFVALP